MTTSGTEVIPTEKTAGPWIVHYGEAVKIKDANGYTVASLSQIHLHGRRSKNEVEKTAQFIVTACNAYEPMREALQGYIDNCTNEECEHCIKARAALKGIPKPASSPIGYLYLNPDTGTEFSENHPVESGECDDAEDIREATAEVLRDELLEAWRQREDAEVELAKKEAAMTEAQIKHMVDRFLVDRFLMWKLPEYFNPDGGISFDPVASKGTPYEFRRSPSGTNLFSAEQATAMVRHMLESLPQPASEAGKLSTDEVL